MEVLEHPLNVVSGMRIWDRFDPIDGVDTGFAGIAVPAQPILERWRPRVVCGDGEDIPPWTPDLMSEAAKLELGFM